MSAGGYDGFVKDFSHVTEGVYLMIYEMIAVFVSNEFFIGRMKAWNTNQRKFKSFTFRKNSIVLSIALFTLILLLFLFPSFVQGISLIYQGYVDQSGEMAERSTFVSLLWQALTTWTYVYIVLLQKARYDKSGEKKYVANSVVLTLVFLLITFIAQSEISRWYTIVNAIACVFFLMKLFPQKHRIILPVTLSPVFLVLLVVSIFKNVSVESEINADAASSIINTRFVNAYLAGPVSTNNAIALYEKGDVGIFNMPYDFVANMPIVNHFFPNSNTLNYLYNDFIGRVWEGHNGDQICPLIGQGLCYFGPVFCIILSIISVFFIRYFDLLFNRSHTPYMYIFAFLAAWFGVEMCLNMTINLSWIYIRVIPMFLLFFFAEKFRL